jgi:uncharacterized protein (DUF1778 family)
MNESTSGSSPMKRTRRLRVRLRDRELTTLAAGAAARGEYLAEFVRKESLAAARTVLEGTQQGGPSKP